MMCGPRTPRVSVIVPAYNKPEYLPECLRSVQAQTFTDWECIVVNDGSPRGDEIRAAVAAMDDPRFRLVEHETNRGPAAARNTGVQAAKADVIAFLDSDDILGSFYLERCLAVLLDHDDRTIVAVWMKRFGDSSDSMPIEYQSVSESLLRKGVIGSIGGVMLRRMFFKACGGFAEEKVLIYGYEDQEFWIRALRFGGMPSIVPEHLYYYRAHKNSTTGGAQARAHLSATWIALRHFRFSDGIRSWSAFLGKGFKKGSYAALTNGQIMYAVCLRVVSFVFRVVSEGFVSALLDLSRFLTACGHAARKGACNMQ